MKKLKISMMSLAMIFFVATTVYPLTTNEPLPTTPPGISYVVEVHMPLNITLCNTYYVTISDQNHNMVAEPQFYQEGVSYYVFHETGPVSGTRVANLEEVISLDNQPCRSKTNTKPDVMKTRFRNNMIYFFTLYPKMGTDNY